MESLHTDSFLREYRGICLGTPPALLRQHRSAHQPGPRLCSAAPWTPMGLPADNALTRPFCRGSCPCRGVAASDGRTHQPRLHLSAVGHPLAGDWLYGTEDPASSPVRRALLPSPPPAPRDPPLAGCHRPAAGGYAPPAPAGLRSHAAARLHRRRAAFPIRHPQTALIPSSAGQSAVPSPGSPAGAPDFPAHWPSPAGRTVAADRRPCSCSGAEINCRASRSPPE